MLDSTFSNLNIQNVGCSLCLWLTNMQTDIPLKIFLTFCFAYFVGKFDVLALAFRQLRKKKDVADTFRPELPPLLTPPTTDDPAIQKASRRLDSDLRKLYAKGLVQGLTVTVVTANGPIFSKCYGTVNTKVSDPEKRRNVDENTIFRICSLTKLLTALKLWMLKEQGAVAWYVSIFLQSFEKAKASLPGTMTSKNTFLSSLTRPELGNST